MNLSIRNPVRSLSYKLKIKMLSRKFKPSTSKKKASSWNGHFLQRRYTKTFDLVTNLHILPNTNSWGNSPGVKCANANTAALIRTETGVGTLQKKQRNRTWKINHECKKKKDGQIQIAQPSLMQKYKLHNL